MLVNSLMPRSAAAANDSATNGSSAWCPPPSSQRVSGAGWSVTNTDEKPAAAAVRVMSAIASAVTNSAAWSARWVGSSSANCNDRRVTIRRILARWRGMAREGRRHRATSTPATVSPASSRASHTDATVDRGATMPGPLEGIRVVELGLWVAGPAAGGILCDWGADVVKIEPPEGDPARTFAKMLGGDLPTNPPFELDNRGKRSVVLDLATEEGRATALELVDTADVFVTNMRKSALARLGLDSDTLLARNDRLVYALVTGFGLEGPDADGAAYDIAAWWSRSGIAWLLTPPGQDPPFQRGGMGDHTVGMTAAGMVCAALVNRATTGKGQLVTTSLLRQGAYTIGFDLNVYLMWGLQFAGGQRAAMRNPSVNNYVAGDGLRFWIVGLEGERHWPPLARVVGRPEWLADHEYSTAAGRATNAR